MDFATNSLDNLLCMIRLLQKQATFAFFSIKKCNIVERKQWVMEVLMPIWTKNSPEPFLISSDGASFEVVVVFNNLIIL